jgi:hypothetical protein
MSEAISGEALAPDIGLQGCVRARCCDKKIPAASGRELVSNFFLFEN